VDCDRIDVTFEDIAGMEEVKRCLQEIISEPLDFPPDLYPVSVECSFGGADTRTAAESYPFVASPLLQLPLQMWTGVFYASISWSLRPMVMVEARTFEQNV